MRVVMGVDGGGSRTRVALVREDGTVLGLGSAGPGNYHDLGEEGVRRSVLEAGGRAWSAAGRAPESTAAACLGVAGAATPEAREALRRLARRLELAPQGHLTVDHDIRIALAGGLGGREGVVLIAGTGSAAYGRREDGASWSAGGCGSFLDDGGSAFDLGRRAMQAALRAADGRGPETSLTESLLRALSLERTRDLVQRADPARMGRAEVAALAPLVTEAAERGDVAAGQVLIEGARDLAHAVRAVVERLELARPRVTYAGGLVESSALYRRRLEISVREQVGELTWVDPCLPPVCGAALLALQSLGVTVTPEVLERLRKTSQGPGKEQNS